MKEILQNPTLIGVIIGSFLSLVGNFVTQYFSLKKEEHQWERQSILSREEREDPLDSKDTDKLIELYHKCILSLSVFITKKQNDNNENDEHKQNILPAEINDIHHWLSLLLIRQPHEKLNRLIDRFLFNPDDYDAEQLRKYVLELAGQEEQLIFPRKFKEVTDKKNQTKEKERTITFQISQTYRREQMVAGIELPESYAYSYEIKNLTSEHRERLLKMYFSSMKRIPDSVQLSLPVCTPKARQINYRGK
jgi:hypothetical protein